MFLTEAIDLFVRDQDWLQEFDCRPETKKEQWGVVTTVRAWTDAGEELEFNFGPPSWADVPMDEGTFEVARHGLLIVYDPDHRLERLQKVLNFSEEM